MDFEDFDIISFLEDRDIEYRTEGKNVTNDWVEIECPFCGGDPSQHFGINLSSGLGHCWICGEKSNPIKLVREIDGGSWAESELVVNEFSQDILAQIKEAPKPTKHASKIVWPKHATKEIPTLHRKYLEGRNFDADLLTEKYKLRFVNNMGDWKFRVIIPVIQNSRVVSFTSRDVTNQAEVPYKHLADPKSVVPIKHTLYNLDSVRGTAVLVEGVMDAWRIGDGAVASFGTQLTKNQIAILARLKTLFVLFDSDATGKAEKLAEELATNVPNVEIIELSDGDPAELTQNDIRSLRMDLKL
jgi:DNA primase